MRKELKNMYKYQYIVSGGTFDQLHAGHKEFLLAQFNLSEHVLIGITTDKYVKRYKNTSSIAPFTTRIGKLKEFLAEKNLLHRVEITGIDEGDMPSSWERYPIEAIAVTEHTKKGAEKINNLRREKGQTTFEIVLIPHLLDENNNVISSTRIRKGEIDIQGNVILLPKNLREQLQQPFGKLFASMDEWIEKNTISAEKTISIGDEVSETLLKRNFGQKVVVVDLLVQRKRRYTKVSDHTLSGNEHILTIKNPAGHITPELFEAAKTSLQNSKKYVIYIQGEEDLAVLPFVVTAPLGFQIIYGQPGEGVVSVLVTKESKIRAKNLLEKFHILASKHSL